MDFNVYCYNDNLKSCLASSSSKNKNKTVTFSPELEVIHESELELIHESEPKVTETEIKSKSGRVIKKPKYWDDYF